MWCPLSPEAGTEGSRDFLLLFGLCFLRCLLFKIQTKQIPLGGEDVVFEVLQAVIDVDGGGDHAEGGGHHKTEPKPALPAGDAPPGDGGVAGGENQAGDHAVPHLIEIKEDREETEEE